MSTEIATALIVAGGGALTLLGNWAMNRSRIKSEERKNSGSIQTSEAVDLWAESNALRQEYKEQAEANQTRADKLEAQLKEVNAKLLKVMDELTSLKANSDTMIKKIDELKVIISELRAENARLIALKQQGAGDEPE